MVAPKHTLNTNILMRDKLMLKKIYIIPAITLMLGACASTGSSSSANDMSIYEVHKKGRIHVFYDRKEFKSFRKVGESTFRLTRIGAGPKGETLVFGLTKKDKKKPGKIAVIKLYDGKIKASNNFYAEMYKNGRIYVFNNFKDMKTVRDFGHPNYFYLSIGTGPKGETVVYVLNSKNKKKKPLKLISEFKTRNS